MNTMNTSSGEPVEASHPTTEQPITPHPYPTKPAGEPTRPTRPTRPTVNPPEATSAQIEGPVTPAEIPTNPYTALFQGQRLASRNEKRTAVAALLVAFREGSPTVHARAIDELEKLNEVQFI